MNKPYMFCVWCGGGEVNKYPVDFEKAKEIAEELRKDGYDDVVIEPWDYEVTIDWGETK